MVSPCSSEVRSSPCRINSQALRPTIVTCTAVASACAEGEHWQARDVSRFGSLGGARFQTFTGFSIRFRLSDLGARFTGYVGKSQFLGPVHPRVKISDGGSESGPTQGFFHAHASASSNKLHLLELPLRRYAPPNLHGSGPDDSSLYWVLYELSC